jgi:integrase
LKAVINYAVRNKLAKERLEFSYTGGEDKDAVYLTEEEISRLFQFQFKTKKLERVRDRFVVSCQTGLAFTDLSELQRVSIYEEEGEKLIRVRRGKTKVEAIIPLEEETLSILEKYRWKIPRISNQNFNGYIKEACKEAGFTATGRNVDDPAKQLWECITSHTGRRSFCTNAFLSGFPASEIMKISGHTTEKSFFRYIRHNKTRTALDFIKHKRQNKAL